MSYPRKEKGKIDMSKKIPVNPRYKDVESVYDTGPTVHKLKIVSAALQLKRRDEAFYRITVQQLGELLQEYEQDALEGVQDNQFAGDSPSGGPRVVEHEPEAEPAYERPYLILDVRSPQEFAECHICQARNFPAPLLNQDKTTPELFAFRDRRASLVILYDDGGDRLAAQAGTRLTLRGYDNVYVLTRGLAAFAATQPEFVEGTLPKPPHSTPPRSQATHKSPSLLCSAAHAEGSIASGHRASATVSSLKAPRSGGEVCSPSRASSPSRSTNSRGGFAGFTTPVPYRGSNGNSGSVRSAAESEATRRNSLSLRSEVTQQHGRGGGSLGMTTPGRLERSTPASGSRQDGLACSALSKRHLNRTGEGRLQRGGGGDETDTVRSDATVAESVISRAARQKGRF